MVTSDTDGLVGSVLIYMSAIIFTLGVLAAPIYFITGPIVLKNDGAPTLIRVVTQPLVATDDSSMSTTKAEAVLKGLVNRHPDAGRRLQGRVASDNEPTASPGATYSNLAPL